MIEVGFGTSEFVSYILVITNTQGDELWKGQIEAKEVISVEGSASLELENGRMSNAAVEVLRKLPTYYARWEVMGKDVTYEPSRLITSESVVQNP